MYTMEMGFAFSSVAGERVIFIDSSMEGVQLKIKPASLNEDEIFSVYMDKDEILALQAMLGKATHHQEKCNYKYGKEDEED